MNNSRPLVREADGLIVGSRNVNSETVTSFTYTATGCSVILPQVVVGPLVVLKYEGIK